MIFVRESSTTESLEEAKASVAGIQALDSPLVSPVITPRCSIKAIEQKSNFATQHYLFWAIEYSLLTMSEKPKHMFIPTCNWQATSQWSGDLDVEEVAVAADPNYNHILTKVRSNVHSTTTQGTWGTRSNKKSACPGQHTIIHSCGAGKRTNIFATFHRPAFF